MYFSRTSEGHDERTNGMEIVWLPSADEAFFKLLKDVEGLFGTLVAEQVSERIYSHIDLLGSVPGIGVRDFFFSNAVVRYLVNTPNIIYYTIVFDKVVIVAILNSRQSPENIHRVIANILKSNNLL